MPDPSTADTGVQRPIRWNGSEADLRILIDQMPASMAMFDREMRYLAVSPRWMSDYQIVGPCVGVSHHEIVPEMPRHWKDIHSRCLSGESRTIAAERFVRRDGTVRRLQWECHPWCLSTGEISGLIIYSEDMTASQDAEDRLRRDFNAVTRLERLGKLVVQETTLGQVLTEIVDAAIAIGAADFGNIQLLDSKSGDLRIVAHRGFPPWLTEYLDSVAVGHGAYGTALERGARVIVDDVTQSPVLADTPALDVMLKADIRAVQATPLVSRSGKALGMFSTYYRHQSWLDAHTLSLLELLARQAADMIDHVQVAKSLFETNESLKLQAEALHERDERMQAILNTAVDAIITIDREGIVESVNPGAERMFGYTRDELVGRNVSQLMPRPFHDEHDHYIARYLKTREGRVIGIGREVLGKRKDGSTFPLHLVVGEIDHEAIFVGILRDISEQKELQQQILEVAGDEQARIGRELHDGVQQELTGLAMFVRGLQNRLQSVDTLSPQELQEWQQSASGLLDVRNIAAKLSRLIEETHRHVQSLSRDLMPNQIDAESLRTALARLVDWFVGMEQLSCHFEDKAGPLPLDDVTATHLYRIAQEAVQNAVKHSQATRIDISLARHDDHLILDISDNGIGLGGSHRQPTTSPNAGLRTMQYRAGLIGAQLLFENRHEGGLRVRCLLRLAEAAGRAAT